MWRQPRLMLLPLLAPLLLVAAVLLHRAAAVPTDTGCMKWASVSCNDGDCPMLSPTPLIIGHQICSAQGGKAGSEAGGVQGMQICTDPGGTQVGHQNIFSAHGYDSHCAPSGRSCWVRQPGSGGSSSGEQIDNFFTANYAKTNLTWTLFRKGQPIPTNSYQIAGLLLARSIGNTSNQFGDTGNVIPGWVAPQAGGTLGSIFWEDYGSNSADAYYLATCHKPTLLHYGCYNATRQPQCLTLPKGSKDGFSTQQACAAHCKAPPPPPPGPPPSPPHYSIPYLRFAMAIPVDNRVDCTVAQGGKTHTWTDYSEGRFSDWVTLFSAGPATVTVAEAGSGSPLLSATVTLTPGPLVLALRADNTRGPGTYWPPTQHSLESIAASYVPSAAGTSSIRLFNLSPNTPFAGLKSQSSSSLVTDVQYSLGSKWVEVAAGEQNLQVVDVLSGKSLGAPMVATPPLSPSACTLFLLGTQDDVAHPPVAVLEVDAPLTPVAVTAEATASSGEQRRLKLDDDEEDEQWVGVHVANVKLIGGAPRRPEDYSWPQPKTRTATSPVSTAVDISVDTKVAVHTTSPYYRGFNIDMSGKGHANREFFTINFGDERLIYLAKSLADTGGFLRIGGTGNDFVEYGNGIGSHVCNGTKIHRAAGGTITFRCLNATHMAGLCKLARESRAKAVLGLAITHRKFVGSDDTVGHWDPTQARALLKWALAEQQGCGLWGLELGNEFQGAIGPARAASDFLTLRKLVNELWPAEADRPKIVGPDPTSLGNPGNVSAALTRYDAPTLRYITDFARNCSELGVGLHAASAHEYIESDINTSTTAAKLDTSAAVAKALVAAVAAAGVPSLEAWAGEVGPHNGGAPPCNSSFERWANFADIFWYADAMAAHAVAGVHAFNRQDFIGADYGLLDCASWRPTPDYYTALLWGKLMGRKVLGVQAAATRAEGGERPRFYAHCTPLQHSTGLAEDQGGVTVLVVNIGTSSEEIVVRGLDIIEQVDQREGQASISVYALTAVDGLGSLSVELNGSPLAMKGGELPELQGTHAVFGQRHGVMVAARSVSFLHFANAGASACGK